MRFLLLLLSSLTMYVSGYCQFKGGTAAGHAYLKITNVTCPLINTNPFSGGGSGLATHVRLTNVTCTVINANPFTGGIGKGFAHLGLTNIVCTQINTNPFAGGQGNGNSSLLLTNIVCTNVNVNPFAGGQGFGHYNMRLVNTICTPINTNPFLGGAGDGHDNIRITNVTCIPVNCNPFLGGISDGHANMRMTNIVCTVINTNPFSGGRSDGHANLRLQNIACTTVNVNPYRGGIATGYSFRAVTNILCGVGALPVSLIAFNAKPGLANVYLTWQTVSEVNNDFFTVEKSQEGNSFEKVITVKGKGNSTVQSFYESTDEAPYTGSSYYRLKQTDFNGRYTYSETVEVNFTRKFEAFISPNPLLDDQDLILKYESGFNEQLSISISNDIGITVFSGVYRIEQNENKIALKTSFLKNGLYFITVSASRKTEIFKLWVNR
jgi:hypothetical protein